MSTQNLSDLDDYIKEFLMALEDEIQELRKSKGQKIYLINGQYLGKRSDGHYLYIFTADIDITLQDETPIELEVKAKNTLTKGILVSVEGFDITLALQEKIGDVIPSAILNTSPIFLLEALEEQLKQALGMDSILNQDLAMLLLTPNSPSKEDKTGSASDLISKLENRSGIPIPRNSSQEAAVEKVLSHKVSFIWGPPGTGKTTTLGMTVAALTMAGESVLVLSHSNMAVDIAMLSIAKYLSEFPSYREGLILRHGIPTPNLLNKYPKLRAKKVLEYLDPKFIEQIDNLKKQRSKYRQEIRHYQSIRSNKYNSTFHRQQAKSEIDRLIKQIDLIDQQIKPLEEERKAREIELVVRAEIVGCTISKAIIAKEIHPDKYDTVIIDEASMVSIPQCVFAALLAKRRIAIYGDFRQLGPIAKADTLAVQKWLKSDIFEQSGVMDQVNIYGNDSRMVMLNIQYRMHPTIANIPNKMCYGQKIFNDSSIIERTQEFINFDPFPGKNLILEDISNLKACCIKETESFSRFNILSALIAVNLAYRAVLSDPKTQIGIITPYNAQARLIRQFLLDLHIDKQVKASTVHRFQGSERQTIIFDAVDSLPNPRIGLPLQGGKYSSAMRLANVAVSRAQNKFIGIINVEYVLSKLPPSDSHAFGQFTKYLQDSAKEYRGFYAVDWNGFMSRISDIPKITCFQNSVESQPALKESLSSAKQNIVIYWPHSSFNLEILDLIKQLNIGLYISGFKGRKIDFDIRNSRVWDNKLNVKSAFIGIDNECLWIFQDPTNVESGVLRMTLPKTVNLLYSFLRLIPHYKISLSDSHPFGKCKCEEPLWLHSINNTNLLACIKYPQHPDHDRQRIQPHHAEVYAELTNQLCEQCGAKLEAYRSSSQGTVILSCSRSNCDWRMPFSRLV